MTGVAHLWRTTVRGSPRRQVVGEAAATFVFGTALVAIGLVGTAGTRAAALPSRWLFTLPLVALCLLLLAKRTRPGTAAVAGAGVFAVDQTMGGSIGVLVAYLDLLYCVARWGRPVVVQRVSVLVGLAVVGSGAALYIVTGGLRPATLLSLVVFSVFATPLWWGRSVRSQAELATVEAARREDHQRLAELREGELLREERARMASELHDALAGNLAAIGIHAEASLSRDADGREGTTRESLSAIRRASLAASDELRTMVLLLRSGEDERTSPARLVDLDRLLEQARHRGLVVECLRPDPWPDLPAPVDHAAHRIVQEALTNAATHAPGSAVQVTVDITGEELALTVTNTVSEPPSPRSDGVGLGSMRARATSLGGHVDAGWEDGTWRVAAILPLTTTGPSEGSPS